MINQDIIAQDLFYKLRSRFPKMEMGDTDGQPTFEATKGRFFDFDAIFNEHNLGTVSISINEPGSLKIYFSKNILEDVDSLVSKTWYSFLKEMRKFAMKRLMSFDTRDISKTNLDKRDYGYLANKESVMSESVMKGTSRTSYKPLQKTRLIIRHSKPVDESIPGARSRNIQALFIENADGERFKYPFPHKVGAEAMQRHVANGGLPHDPIGQKIIEMSSDIAKLNSFKKYVYKEDLMNHETNHIVDRANVKLQNMKEMMHKLTKQHHYEAFKHQIECGMMQDRPLLDEITMEEYKSLFTKRSFNETMSEIFPLIHSIMQEGELDLETVIEGHKDDHCDACDRPSDDCVCDHANESIKPEMQFENWATTLLETNLSPEELNTLKGLLENTFPVGVQGKNVISALENLGIEIEGTLTQELAMLEKSQGPDADAKNAVLEFLSKYQPEVYEALGIAPEQQAPVQETMNKPIMINGKEVDISSLEVDGVDTRDSPDFSDSYFSAGEFADGTEMSDQELEQLRDEHGDLLHELVWDSLHETSQPEQQVADEGYFLGPEDLDAWKEEAKERVANGEVDGWTELYAELVSDLGINEKRAEMIAKQIYGDQRDPSHYADDDEVPELDAIDDEEDDDAFISNLRGNIGKHGKIGHEVDEEDKLGKPDDHDSEMVAPKKHDSKEVAKFIMGFYDRETGHFPLGETGVKLKVEKQFGDKAGKLAERLIGQLAARGEEEDSNGSALDRVVARAKERTGDIDELKMLSGQTPVKPTEMMPAPMMAKPAMETADFSEILKLAGLK